MYMVMIGTMIGMSIIIFFIMRMVMVGPIMVVVMVMKPPGKRQEIQPLRAGSPRALDAARCRREGSLGGIKVPISPAQSIAF